MTAAVEFFDWWKTQLSELIPPAAYKFFQRARTTLTLKLEGDHAQLLRTDGEVAAEFDVPSAQPGSIDGTFEHDTIVLPGSPQRLSIVLEPGQYLLRQITLPRAAKPHLTEAVGYQLQKLTPFSADQVRYACGTLPDSAPDAPLNVWLAVVPLHKLATALAVVGQSPPANPLQVSKLPAPNSPLEFSWRIEDTTAAGRRNTRIAWVLLLALWVGALGLHLYKRSVAYDALDQTLTDLRGQAADVTGMEEKLSSSMTRLEWLAQRKHTTTSALVMLDSLTRLLDDKTWLQRLDYDGEKVILTGVSSASSNLIETLESSSMFEDVQFDAFTRDSRSSADRFNINARVEKSHSKENPS